MADFKDINKCVFKAKEDFVSANNIEATVATTGYCGGDSGNGGRTYIKIADTSSTDIDFRISSDSYGDKQVELMLGGDCELDTIIDAFHWIADTLSQMRSCSRWIVEN